ncbi:MAG: tRNA (adenosine(37)-N6)-threonylcarbamoyltransferase complex dimerization subunit type 1 TsaB [Blastocatellia bacterium]|nr:tRNA (adenosine(37)-N6)-threonylcarbamoyltransferase complex dimerization subunit type 1 TsaB [Blastocatellia bacterium]
MIRTTLHETVLAIETGVLGGSLSIVRSGIEIAGISGDSNFSRAEDLLANIKSLIQRAGISKSDIRALAVSRGPGSYTGIRIGLATAAGLSRSLQIPAIGVPLLDAIALMYGVHRSTAVVMPFGRSDFVIQRFTNDPQEAPNARAMKVVDPAGLREALAGSEFETLICHKVSVDVLKKLLESIPTTPKLVAAESNLALAVYFWSAAFPNSVDMTPIYAANPIHANNLF